MEKNNTPRKILISCFACGPNWGSEVGMGWNWIIHLAQHCQLYVITEKEFQNDIESKIDTIDIKYKPEFYYIDIGEQARSLFWKQGSFSFYKFYKSWQQKAFLLANRLIAENEIDIIHQLNLIGFREPGYLWKLSSQKPFIWGPVGGFNQVPFNYILRLSLKNKIFYWGKNFLNFLQIKFKKRVKKAFLNSNMVLAESTSTKIKLKKNYTVSAILMNETGGDFTDFFAHSTFCANNKIHLLWVGRIQGLKALPIALYSLQKIKNKIPFEMTVVGDGPDETECKKLVHKLGLNNFVKFTGRINNTEVKKLMREHDLLFFTSLKEGTPHVVLEALSNGLPVLCHDACGHGDIVDESCGIKIPMKSFSKSVVNFSDKIEYLFNNQSELYRLSQGTKNCVLKHSWKSKAAAMVEFYEKNIQPS